MLPAIAIVGMACRYPDARSPQELWENVLACRRAFRRMPPERLRAEDYLSAEPDAPDRTYVAEAALIEGYEFDRVHYRVVGSTFRSADLAHWLALDVAAGALADAGFPDGEGLPRERTGVALGNTLTGEFSRANVMRLRWPYVRRVVEAALTKEGWKPEQRRTFLEELEAQYKSPFPPVGEETLAGGLSNTIAGRICNYFDLKGGGYTVDGACAASLLAVASACSALVAGDLDVALAGGVDLSLDPFEIVGFAKTGALAPEEMRVYDTRSAGFWPGEGCGFVVLMRHEDAVAQGRRIYAVIRGWGISSDGSGGITRPEAEGQILALRRAYDRAGFGIETVAYFEGHGTGTSVGDATELQALTRARREAAPDAPPAAIGSIKANIGHTKAAAGVAGLIKATMAVHMQLLPPNTGCERPHPELTGAASALRALREGAPWPADRPLRAGVSAMGFGGINTHIVLEGIASARRTTLRPEERVLLSSAQDAELILLEAPDAEDLRRQVEHLLTFAARLSRAEVADLAACLTKTAPVTAPQRARAAIVASSPAELANRLERLRAQLADGATVQQDVSAGVFFGLGNSAPRIGLLFPGQGSPAHLDGGAWRRRFETVRQLYARADLPTGDDDTATEVAQPAIVTASTAALRVLEAFGIEAAIAIGHSLGELTAYHWAGAYDEETLRRIAAARGRVMAELGSSTGAMASLGAGPQEVEELLKGQSAWIAGFNAPCQTVISGEATAVEAVVAHARARGLRAVRLPVSHAFHSPLVAAAAPVLIKHLRREPFQPLRRTVASTITGALLSRAEDLRALLRQQVTSPVRFTEAVQAAAEGVDLWIEAGPGQVLSGLMTQMVDVPGVPTDAGGPSLKELLHAVGMAFALGAPVRREALFAGRFTRPFDLDWRPRFFVNPCELAPVIEGERRETERCASSRSAPEEKHSAQHLAPDALSPLDLVRQLVAERTELPPAAVKDESRLLSDLHLNSITVGQLVAEAARRLGLPPPAAPGDYADATVAGVARALEEQSASWRSDPMRTEGSDPVGESGALPSGIASWIRAFTVEWVERALPRRKPFNGKGAWRVIAPPGHALAASLREALARSEGGGVVVCLPPEPDEGHIGLMLEGARAVSAEKENARFVMVQPGGVGAAFARTLHLEAPQITTCVVEVPPEHPNAAEWVRAEAMAASGYTEARYDITGKRWEPVLRLLPMPEVGDGLPLGPEDVLLVTGGGKGIAAECALALARETGARLALLGRSQPEADAELRANLDRMAASGVRFRYVRADVTDAEAVRAAVDQAEEDLGPITALLHGAGTNVPQRLASLEEAAFRRTLAPKVGGARNVLAALDSAQLRLFITFGSLIARTGMRGEADYAVANAWLTRLTQQWQQTHPHCRCLAIEWSVWSGVGMGERLGRVDALLRAGITPIPPDEGVRILRRLLSMPLPGASVVVSGRFGEAPTLQLERPDLPFRRFLEQPRVYFPGVELIADSQLSGDTDPYLNDHALKGERLFPAVMGLEAMAQVAMALVGTTAPPVFEEVQFLRPIVVAQGASVKIRVAALVREQGRVEVALRSAETAFGVNHFRATCRFEEGGDGGRECWSKGSAILPRTIALAPEPDLYGTLLFHSGRFRRLRNYRHLRATECLAEISPEGASDWFGRYLPAELVLGDPGARDAAIHAIQACIPHATILPIGVDRLTVGVAPLCGLCFVYACERSRDGDTFTYDLQVMDADGCVRERWEGLRLRRVGEQRLREPWPAPLLGPYIERRIGELIPGAVAAVVVERAQSPDRRTRSDQAIRRALGETLPLWRRPDGKPEVMDGRAVSAAHTGDLTLAVAGPEPLGCDVEPVIARSTSVWQDLLGPERCALAGVLAREIGEDQDAAATRIWTAMESLKKAGALVNAPLTLAFPPSVAPYAGEREADGWVLLSSGSYLTATCVTRVRDMENKLAVAVLVGAGHARL